MSPTRAPARRPIICGRAQPWHFASAGSMPGREVGQRRCFAELTAAQSPYQRYRAMVASGDITHDDNQARVVRLLDDMAKTLVNYTPSPAAKSSTASKPAAAQAKSGGGFFGGLFGGGAPAAPAQPKAAPTLKPQGPKGLYVWGGCGTGKTFLMDLFYDSVPVERKKRIHFHEWMIDVHERLHRLQKSRPMIKEKANTVWTAEAAMAQRKELQSGGSKTAAKESADDLVGQVAKEMMTEGWLLCFDEFQVTHISDAIIMKRLFGLLFEAGAVVIATSNRPPEDLYLNGLNRPLFLPFIPMLKDFCDVHDIASETDYRLTGEGEEKDRRVYIYPNGIEEAKLLERKFYRIAHQQVVTGGQVETQGRRISVPKSAMNSQVAWFDFKNLCDRPLGAADYLAIASVFHTVFVANIPKLTLQERDQVRRFITMIDAFYERHTKLVCTADLDPINLFQVSEEDKRTSSADEIFAWDRTVSRLIEMQSTKYLSEFGRKMDGDQFMAMFDINALSEDDLTEFWRRYDRDDSGEIDHDELKLFLQDVIEMTKGHRNVAPEIFEECLSSMDTDGNGSISFEEFDNYLRHREFKKPAWAS